jgi:hypothetical protein
MAETCSCERTQHHPPAPVHIVVPSQSHSTFYLCLFLKRMTQVWCCFQRVTSQLAPVCHVDCAVPLRDYCVCLLPQMPAGRAISDQLPAGPHVCSTHSAFRLADHLAALPLNHAPTSPTAQLKGTPGLTPPCEGFSLQKLTTITY